MDNTYESQSEYQAECGCMERLRRIHFSAGELLSPCEFYGLPARKNNSVRKGGIGIELRENGDPEISNGFPVKRRVKMERERSVQQPCRDGARAEPDKPIAFCIEYGKQSEHFRVSLEERSVWEGGKQMPPETHAMMLDMLHRISDILEGARIEEIQNRIREEIERRKSQLASVVVLQERMVESERLAAEKTV